MVLGYNVVKPGAALCYGICGLCAPRFRAAGSIGIRGGSGCCRFPSPANPRHMGYRLPPAPHCAESSTQTRRLLNGKL